MGLVVVIVVAIVIERSNAAEPSSCDAAPHLELLRARGAPRPAAAY